MPASDGLMLTGRSRTIEWECPFSLTSSYVWAIDRETTPGGQGAFGRWAWATDFTTLRIRACGLEFTVTPFGEGALFGSTPTGPTTEFGFSMVSPWETRRVVTHTPDLAPYSDPAWYGTVFEDVPVSLAGTLTITWEVAEVEVMGGGIATQEVGKAAALRSVTFECGGQVMTQALDCTGVAVVYQLETRLTAVSVSDDYRMPNYATPGDGTLAEPAYSGRLAPKYHSFYDLGIGSQAAADLEMRGSGLTEKMAPRLRSGVWYSLSEKSVSVPPPGEPPSGAGGVTQALSVETLLIPGGGIDARVKIVQPDGSPWPGAVDVAWQATSGEEVQTIPAASAGGVQRFCPRWSRAGVWDGARSPTSLPEFGVHEEWQEHDAPGNPSYGNPVVKLTAAAAMALRTAIFDGAFVREIPAFGKAWDALRLTRVESAVLEGSPHVIGAMPRTGNVFFNIWDTTAASLGWFTLEMNQATPPDVALSIVGGGDLRVAVGPGTAIPAYILMQYGVGTWWNGNVARYLFITARRIKIRWRSVGSAYRTGQFVLTVTSGVGAVFTWDLTTGADGEWVERILDVYLSLESMAQEFPVAAHLRPPTMAFKNLQRDTVFEIGPIEEVHDESDAAGDEDRVDLMREDTFAAPTGGALQMAFYAEGKPGVVQPGSGTIDAIIAALTDPARTLQNWAPALWGAASLRTQRSPETPTALGQNGGLDLYPLVDKYNSAAQSGNVLWGGGCKVDLATGAVVGGWDRPIPAGATGLVVPGQLYENFPTFFWGAGEALTGGAYGQWTPVWFVKMAGVGGVGILVGEDVGEEIPEGAEVDFLAQTYGDPPVTALPPSGDDAGDTERAPGEIQPVYGGYWTGAPYGRLPHPANGPAPTFTQYPGYTYKLRFESEADDAKEQATVALPVLVSQRSRFFAAFWTAGGARLVSMDVSAAGRLARAYITGGMIRIGVASSIAAPVWTDRTTTLAGSFPCLRWDTERSGGRLWLLYKETGSGAILLRSSDNEGQTWSAAMTITSSGRYPVGVFTRHSLKMVYWRQGDSLYSQWLDGANAVKRATFAAIPSGVNHADLKEYVLEGGKWRLGALVRTSGGAVAFYTSIDGITFTLVS